jgi:branched-chain amino acid transport system ATP-binding protein
MLRTELRGIPTARAPASKTLLELDRVSRHFGKLQAVQDVSFRMTQGEVRAVIGPNGAGKTTFFNLVSGFFPVSAGEIRFLGERIDGLSVTERVALGIVRTFQITEVFPELTVFENVRFAAERAMGITSRPFLSRGQRAALVRHVEEAMAATELTRNADRVVGELAHGDQRVVEVALALALRPRLLMLDEPTAGMGDEETAHMVHLIERLRSEQGLSILFIEHDMDIVFGIADRITVLDQGRLLAEGTPEQVGDDERVRAAYLGEADALA